MESTTNLIHNGAGNYYFRSSDIRIFPSAFRGTYEAITEQGNTLNLTFDPEARLNTEANFILPKATTTESSYIIEYNQTQKKLRFILGGYYFELSNVDQYVEDLKDHYLGILVRSIKLVDASKESIQAAYQHDSDRTTLLIDSWEATADNILDAEFDGEYAFTGLNVFSELSATSINTAAKLKIFLEDGSINQLAYLPEIKHGSGETSLRHGENLIAAGKNQTVLGQFNENNPNALLEVGVGTSITDRKNALEVVLEVDDTVTPATVTRKTNINTNTTITGNTSVSGTVNIGGKATSAATSSSDSATTLATKGYVDSLIGGINTSAVTPPAGGGGSYITAVSQTGAKIATSSQAFDAVINSSSTHNNAPTAKAVNELVKNTIESLDVDYAGGDGQYIKRIREVDGKIETSVGEFKTVLNPNAADATNTVPTVMAIYNYIEGIKDELNDGFASTLGSTVSGMAGGTTSSAGEYLTGVTQSGGKIEASTKAFDTAISSLDASNNSTAPTSSAVYNFVEDTVKDILNRTDLTSATRNSAGQPPADTLEYKILDLIYPVGSIYIHYPNSATKGAKCPIQIGTWSLIDSGKFLCAANNTATGSYAVCATGGSAELKLRNHAHEFTTDGSKSNVTVTGGMSANSTGSLTFRRMNDSGSYPVTGTSGFITTTATTASGSKHGCIGWGGKTEDRQKISLNIAHTHSITDSNHEHTGTTNNTGTITDSDALTANLPPFIAVHIWRRVS